MADWIYGRRAAAEILRSDQKVHKVLVARGVDPREMKELEHLASHKHIAFEIIEKRVLNSIVRGNHQGVAVQVESQAPQAFKAFLLNLQITKKTFLCLLDEIQDPQNLGAVIRNAVCFGCSGIILPKWRSTGVTPAVMKASAGALAHCPIAEVANLTVAVERLKEKGFYIYGADADPEAQGLNSAELDFPLALILGSEHRGIKPVLKKVCDKLLRVSQSNAVASLNVSSASAIFFYDIMQR